MEQKNKVKHWDDVYKLSWEKFKLMDQGRIGTLSKEHKGSKERCERKKGHSREADTQEENIFGDIQPDEIKDRTDWDEEADCDRKADIQEEESIFEDIQPDEIKGCTDWDEEAGCDRKADIQEEESIFEDIQPDEIKGCTDWDEEAGYDEETDTPEGEDIFDEIPSDEIKDRTDWTRESKQYPNPISKNLSSGVFTQIKDTDMQDWEPYVIAQVFCKMHKLMHLFLLEKDEDIWLFKEKAGYDYIDGQKLGTLIYEMLPDELKHQTRNITSYIKNVTGYIYKELAIHPSKMSLNVGKCFNPKDFEQIKYHALFQNGVYDLEKRELHPHFGAESPYYLPIQAKYVKKPNKYLLKHTKNFQKLLWDTTDGDEETMEMIMSYLAYFMIPYKSREIVFITGPTASGKSIFADLVDALIPPDRISRMNITDFGGRFSLGNANKYLLINGRDVEISGGELVALKPRDISILKQCSGDSVITTEAKGKMPRSTHVLFKLLFACNGPVVPAHPDHAYEDRVTLLPFMRSVEKSERDPELGQKILAEKDCIITLCMRKLQDYINDGGKIILPLSEKSRMLRNEWFNRKDFIQEFVSAKVEFTGDKDDFVKNKEIVVAYKKYYRECMEKTNDMRSSMARQSDVLEEVLRTGRGQAEEYRQDNKRGIAGIRLL